MGKREEREVIFARCEPRGEDEAIEATAYRYTQQHHHRQTNETSISKCKCKHAVPTQPAVWQRGTAAAAAAGKRRVERERGGVTVGYV